MSLLKNPPGDNPLDLEPNKNWFRPATYPAGVCVCPLCALPETSGVYEVECHCWDKPAETAEDAFRIATAGG